MKTVFLKEQNIRDRSHMCAFFHELYGPSFHAVSAEEAEARLRQVETDTEFILTHRQSMAICNNPFAYEALLAIGRAAEDNPHIVIHIRSGGAADR